MIKTGSKLKILKTANKATALLPNGKISKVASMEDKSEYSNDFIYFIARALTANVPNANGDYFPEDELEKSYESFIGKNLHLNHDADDVAKAVGKIIDAWFVRTDGDIYVVCLCKIDRKLHPELARNVETGIIDSVSMGCSCQECECSICGKVAHNENEMCEHLKNFLGREIDVNGEKKKVSSINRGITFNELSLVGDPADSNAHMYQIYANKRSDNMKKVAMQDGKTEDVVQEEVKQEIEKTVKDKEESKETKAEEKTVKEEVKEVKEEIKETVEQLDQAKEIIEEKKEELKELKEEVKDIKEEKKEETIEKEESCNKKAETEEESKEEVKEAVEEKVEEVKEIVDDKVEEIVEDVKEVVEEKIEEVKEEITEEKKEEDIDKKAEESIEEVKEEAKEEVKEDKENKEEEKVETLEQVQDKVEEIKEELVAEIGGIFSPVKDETKEYEIKEIFEDNGEQFVETEVEGKKKVYALKNVKLRKKAEEGETEEEIKEELQRISDVIATSYADSKALLPTERDIVYLQDHQEEIKKFFPEDVDLWQWANIPEEEWNNKDAYVKTKAMKKQAEAPAKPTTAPSAGMKWVFDKNTNSWKQMPENTNTVEVEATNSYKYTLIKSGENPRWLIIDKNTNKIAHKLYLKDLPKEASSFGYKQIIAKTIAEKGLEKTASLLTKKAIKVDDTYTMTSEDGSTSLLKVKSISINDMTKETFINVQIGDATDSDNIFSLSKFMKMIEDGQLVKNGEEIKEEAVNNVEKTEDDVPMEQDETSEPMNDLQSSRKEILKRRAFSKKMKMHKKAEIELDKNEQKQVNKIIKNFDPVAVKYEGNSNDGYSVLIKDKKSNFNAWVDVWVNEDYQDVETDWNQYIFHTNDADDRIKSAVQDDTETVYDLSTSVAIGYLEEKGLIVNGDEGWSYGKSSKKSSKHTLMNRKAEAGDGELVPQADPTPDFKLAPEVAPNETNTLETEDVKKEIIKKDLTPMEEIANLISILQEKLSIVDDKESKLDFVRKEIQDAIDFVDGKPIEEIEDGKEELDNQPEIAEFTDIKWEDKENETLPTVASVDVDDINWNNINAKKEGGMILAHIFKSRPLSYKVAFKKINRMNKTASNVNKVSFVNILKEQISLAHEEMETMKITAQIKERKEECNNIVKEAMAKGLVEIPAEEISRNIMAGMSQVQAREEAVRKAADEKVKNLMSMDKAGIEAFKQMVAKFKVPSYKIKTAQTIGRITASADYEEKIELPWSRKR